MTKMAVTRVDPPYPKTLWYAQTYVCVLYNRRYCRSNFYIGGIWIFD